MADDLSTWQEVTRDTTLLDRAAAVDASDVSAVAALRRDYAADRVAVALELCRARAKAVAKFGERGRLLVCDVPGVEQASGGAVASYKAGRLREALGEGVRVADLCCGIGGDSMAIVDTGLAVMSVDRDALRTWMVSANTGGKAEAVCADVAELTGLALDGVAVHMDPARRDESTARRAWRIDDYQPGPDAIGRLIEAAPAAALKLSPGIDVEALPWPGGVEFISEAGRLVQAVLWCGALRGADRAATMLVDGDAYRLEGEPTRVPIAPADRYLYTFDASAERAELVGALCEHVGAPALHPKLGLLTSDKVINSPWLTGFELIERMPWRPKRVAQWLRANDGGLVEVKTRGKACDPDREQQRLRSNGGTTYTVFVLRFDMKVEALITRRLVDGVI